MLSRRAFVRGAGAAVLGLAAVGTARADHRTHQPPHVTLSFPKNDLKSYRPKLITRHLSVRPSAQYAWKATSPEHDTDAYVYFTYYVRSGSDAITGHIHDREPVYVFVDNTTGAVREVVYAGYHWLAARTMTPFLEDTHPTFRVAQQWHHYLHVDDASGVYVDLEDLDGIFDDWLATGWEEDLHPGAVVNPWVMRSRASWWRENDLGFAGGRLFARLWLALNVRGAGDTDLE